MGAVTEIGWTDHTFNPWWGCVRVAQGCKNCYAETLANRWGMNVWGPGSDRRFFGDKHWREPEKWNRDAEDAGVRRRVFCGSMCDVLEDRPDLIEHRRRLSILIENTPALDWQLLTKRPENWPLFARWAAWPANVWFGTSAAVQTEFDENAAQVFGCPAALRFFSLEPLVGPIDLSSLKDLCREPSGEIHLRDEYPRRAAYGPPAEWVIVGGESGPGRRECEPEWVDAIVAECAAADVACFVKQDSGPKPGMQGRLSDATWSVKQFPVSPASERTAST